MQDGSEQVRAAAQSGNRVAPRRSAVIGLLVPLLMALAGCSILYHELNTAKSEGRPFTWRRPHPAFPDSLDAEGKPLPNPTLTAKQVLYNDLEPVLEEADSSALAACASLAEIGVFEREYWRVRDSVPSTEANEARESHYRRLAVARAEYPDSAVPSFDPKGIDARGRDLVLFGHPLRRVRSDGGSGIKSSGIEHWYWDGMVAAYLDINNDGVFLKWSTGSIALQEQEETYWERAWTKDAEPEVLAADFAIELNPLRFERGIDGATNVLLSYQFDRRQLEKVVRSDRRGFVQSVAIQDTATSEILAFEADTISLSTRVDSLWTGRFALSSPPGRHRLSISVEDLISERAEHHVSSVDVPEFPDGGFRMGSIAFFAHSVSRAEPDNPVSPIVRELFIPHPQAVYGEGDDVCIELPLYVSGNRLAICGIQTTITRVGAEEAPYRVSKTYMFDGGEETVASCHNGPFEAGIYRVRVEAENRSTPFADDRNQIVHASFRVRAVAKGH